jgi:hypothetical protein
VFFVSVASKGFGQTVSLLFAPLARRSISVAAKGLKAIAGSDPTMSGQVPFSEEEAEDPSALRVNRAEDEKGRNW